MLWPAFLALPPVVLLAACSAPETRIGPAGASTHGDASTHQLGTVEPGASAGAKAGAARPDGCPLGDPVANPRAAQTFDAAWTIVRDTHFDPRHLDPAAGGVDWVAVRDELRPFAIASSSPEQLREQLDAMLARLGQSHFVILAGESTTPSSMESPSLPRTELDQALSATAPAAGSLGIDVRMIDGEAIVSSLVAGLPGDSAGVRAGWEVVAVDGRSVASELADGDLGGRTSQPASWRPLREVQGVVEMLDGPLGESRTVSFRTIDGSTTERRMSLWPMPGALVQLHDLPPLHARLTARDASEHELAAAAVSGRRVGVIAFNVWMPPMARPFHQAVDRFRGADGMIVDLRGNAGGIGGMAPTLAAHFSRHRFSLGTLRTRSESLEFLVNPCYATAEADLAEPFEGPLAILVDELSASTSEIFAGGLQCAGRARVFGRPTAGAALPARTSRLPNGDTLVHAVADFTLPDGTRLESRGVTPDELVPLRRSDLVAERDEVLLAALRWIAISSPISPPISPPLSTNASTARLARESHVPSPHIRHLPSPPAFQHLHSP